MSSSSRRYRFAELLGEGGFGVVYKAAMLGADGFEKPVAIKLLRLGGGDGRLAEEAQQRFRDEARLLGLLRHRAIVQVDGLVRIGGHQAVVMEYLEGVSLRALVKRAPVPERPALEIVAEVAAALEAAWHRPGPAGKPLNVCHRDLKPANLQLSADGELKVLDFGIARADFQAREAETRSLAMGSVEYMSPKRLDFDDDGAAGDIYSLGCVLFEMLVGEAFGRTSANPKSHQQRFDTNIGRAPESCREMIGRMLAFDPADRPNAREVERACLELARTQPLSLRDWAADAVPACLAETKLATGSWSGKLLAEDSEAVPAPPPPPEVRPRYVVGGSTGVAPTVSADRAEVARALEAPEPARPSGPVSRSLGPITASNPMSGPITGSGPLRADPASGARRPEGATVARRTGPITGARKEGPGTATKAGAAALGVMGIGSIALGCILAVVAIALAVRGFGGGEAGGAAVDPSTTTTAAGSVTADAAGSAGTGASAGSTGSGDQAGATAGSGATTGGDASASAASVPGATDGTSGTAPTAAGGASPSGTTAAGASGATGTAGAGTSATGTSGGTTGAGATTTTKAATKTAKPKAETPAVDPGLSATIELSGNAEAVRLRSNDATYALPMVPAGTYTVLATFDGKEVEAGSVTVGEAEKVILKCKKAFLRCTR